MKYCRCILFFAEKETEKQLRTYSVPVDSFFTSERDIILRS